MVCLFSGLRVNCATNLSDGHDRAGEAHSFRLVTSLVGMAGAIVGADLSHQGDIDAKIIEISVGVLRAEPTKETMPLRGWGIDVIEKRAGFKFTSEQEAALKNKSLPYAGPALSRAIGEAVAWALRIIP